MSIKKEQIVMTPKKKTSNSTTIMMERKVIDTGGDKVHIGGGSNAGIVVNKQRFSSSEDEKTECHLFLEFKVFLVNSSTKKYTQETRVLSYWFKEECDDSSRTGIAHDFFKTFLKPDEFPRDYVGFIKKIMKLMQTQYPLISKIEVQMTQEKEMDKLPSQSTNEKYKPDILKSENLLKIIEESYPNSLTIDDMSRRFDVTTDVIRSLISELLDGQLVKPVGAGVNGTEADSGASAFRRVHQNEDQVTIVKHMPRGLERSVNPTIAVITSQYHEKMAVDAVMTNKRTFMRYATVGEANVYTLGDIGSHRVVSTKLPVTGHSRDALIATGGTTTRLLGTFQNVERVFLVGVGGAVPHYTDFSKHVRLGDVVISVPSKNSDRKFMYEYVQSVDELKNGTIKFESKTWCPSDSGLQDIARTLIDNVVEGETSEWRQNFKLALREMEVPEDWQKPDSSTDKLYMNVGGNDFIDVEHPVAPKNSFDPREYGDSLIHLGPIASGRSVSLNSSLRESFAHPRGILAFDSELDAVVESIYGNRKDQYMIIRGMSDYYDGSSKNKEWRRFASLMAASVLKCIVERLQEF